MRLAALAFALLAAFLPPAMAQETALAPDSISLTGDGEVSVSPDMAVLSIGVQSFERKPDAALAANNGAMARVIEGLKKAGVAEKDLLTRNFSVAPRMSYTEGQAARLDGFDVSHELVVTVRDLGKLGALLTAAVADGSNVVNGVDFSLSDPETAGDAARKAAFADAHRKAELYAAAAGRKLGPLIRLDEAGSRMEARPKMSLRMAADAAPVPVQSGEQQVSVSISASWRLE